MKVFVFDLDFTLWNAGDTFCSETSPPYRWVEGKLLDQSSRWIRIYPDVHRTLQFLKGKGLTLAIASRTNEPDWARQLLQFFDLDKYFDIREIYPGDKTTHLKKIQEQANCPFHQIIFFDDEERNIADATSLGIESVLVENGISYEKVIKYASNTP